MYKKRKKTRRYDNGGMTNDDDFTRQDSTDVYDYRNLINFFDGLDPAKITEAAEILSRGDENIKYNKLFRKMKDIKELNEKMGDLGDFNPNKKAAGGMVDNSNQPDSLTNYIKGNDKYRMGGVPNDDNFSDMGDNMKHGGMVNKSKSGNRDPFTNQYD